MAVAVVWCEANSVDSVLQIDRHEGCGPGTDMRYRACVAIGFFDEGFEHNKLVWNVA